MTIKFNEFTIKVITSDDSENPQENGKYFGAMVFAEGSIEKPQILYQDSLTQLPLLCTSGDYIPQEALGNIIIHLMTNALPEAFGSEGTGDGMGCKHIELEDIQEKK